MVFIEPSHKLTGEMIASRQRRKKITEIITVSKGIFVSKAKDYLLTFEIFVVLFFFISQVYYLVSVFFPPSHHHTELKIKSGFLLASLHLKGDKPQVCECYAEDRNPEWFAKSA